MAQLQPCNFFGRNCNLPRNPSVSPDCSGRLADNNRQTIIRLYVLRTDGSRIGPGRALARFLATIVSNLILYIGYLMIGIRRDKRGLHDLICDTKVVKRRR